MYYILGVIAAIFITLIVLWIVRINRRENIVDDDYPDD